MYDNTPTGHPQDVPEQDAQETALARRALLAGTGMLAVAAAVAGCSSYGGDTAQPEVPGAAPESAPAPPAPGGEQLTSVSDVPVGGGQVFPAQLTVVTQPEQGTFEAFSAICTHQGCTVKDVKGGTINCACHGGAFAIADGSAVKFPAVDPLPPKTVTVSGGKLYVT